MLDYDLFDVDDDTSIDYHQPGHVEASFTGDHLLNEVSRNIQVGSDELVPLESPIKQGVTLTRPHVGMMFDSLDIAENYYEDYGRQQGFWMYTRSSSKSRSRSNDVTNKLFVCSHYGKHAKALEKEMDIEEEGMTNKRQTDQKRKKRLCSTLKGDCKACMRIRHDKYSDKWLVSIFNDEHNHKVVSPIRRMKMRSNRKLPKAAKDLTEAFNRENLQIGKVPSIIGGKDIGFDSRDCYNHLRNVRYRELQCGDAQSVLTYFRKKQVENPQFFYAIQCDENGRACNFFWVDARSRMAYQYFGDVVTFDTTYKTNIYEMPFAPFTGVNHHFQSIQFGCALLQDETESTFMWLFETWHEAMGGHPPRSIITDQDLAMKGAIAKVFPNTRHRLCIWHIKKKFGEKLSNVYYKKSEFKIEMKHCIWGTYTATDFEEKWNKLIEKNDLKENEWLQQLYKIRESWVPVYHRDTFYAGMNTTGRSEGVNAFFDAFVTSQTNLRDFVVKYEQALKQIVKKESDEDFISEHKYRIVDDDKFILKHAGEIYTRNIFKKFKEEWGKVSYYRVEEKGSDGAYHQYLVKTKLGDHKQFLVKLNLQTYEGNCECKKFEFFGILCKHLLKVFCRLDIDSIPQHFILPRWMKEANKFRIMDSRGTMCNEGEDQQEALRLSYMCQEATKLACYAATSHETYEIFVKGIKELSEKVEVVKNCVKDSEHVTTQPSNMEPSTQVLLLDPNISQTKGRKKDVTKGEIYHGSKRLKSGIELSTKKQRKCKLCRVSGHDKRLCPLNRNKKKGLAQDGDDRQEE